MDNTHIILYCALFGTAVAAARECRAVYRIVFETLCRRPLILRCHDYTTTTTTGTHKRIRNIAPAVARPSAHQHHLRRSIDGCVLRITSCVSDHDKMNSSVRSKSSQYSASSSRRGTKDSPLSVGASSTRRARRTPALPTRSLGYFPIPASPSRSNRVSARSTGRARNSARHVKTASSDDSSVSASRSRCSVEFAKLAVRPAPVLPEADLEPVTEPEADAECAPVSCPSHQEPRRPPVVVLGQARCAVENDFFRIGETVARLPCGHVFHRDCIVPFVSHARNGGYCPIDGAPVERAQIAQLPVWRVSEENPCAPVLENDDGDVHVEAEPVSFSRTIARESDAATRKWTPQFRACCAIDGQRFRQGELCVQLRGCGHVFHARCVHAYLVREIQPRCPCDGQVVCEGDAKLVVVSDGRRGGSTEARAGRRAEPRAKDYGVRRALRALNRAQDALRDALALEAVADAYVRLDCVRERAESVQRRCTALGDVPMQGATLADACVVDRVKFSSDERAVVFECGHALHARCANAGMLCDCVGADTGERRSGRVSDLLPAIAEAAAMRWRCAELVVAARERSCVRGLDANGDARAGVAMADAAASEIRSSLRRRRNLLTASTKAQQQNPGRIGRRLSLPELLRNARSMHSSHGMDRENGKTAPVVDELSVRISAGLASPLPSRVAKAPALARRYSTTAPANGLAPRSTSEVTLSSRFPLVRRRRRSKRQGSTSGTDSVDSRLSCESQRLAARHQSADAAAGNQGVVSECEHGNGNVCVLDGKPILRNDEIVRLPCLHVFHRQCVLPHLINCDRPACPVDLTVVPQQSLQQLLASS